MLTHLSNKMTMEFIIICGIVFAILLSAKFAYGASPPVALPSPDYLTENQYSLYGNLDCNNPNVVAGFVWNYSDFLSPKEQCDYYTQAAKIMHTKVGIELEANITIKNITIK